MSESNAMQGAIKKFILNRRLKKEEGLLTTKLEKEKDGGINEILITNIKNSGQCFDDLKDISDRKKTKDTSVMEFQYQKYCDLLALAAAHCIDVNKYKAIYEEQKQKVLYAHHFATWLENNCKYAEGVSVATHVSKLTHSSNKASCFFDQIQIMRRGYITTSIIDKPVVDGAYDNALYSPIVSLFLVENSGRYFYEDIIDNNFEGLINFANDEKQLAKWKVQLKKSIDKPTKTTDALLKQIYFPVKGKPLDTEDWHLLSVLTSSSLAHAIFDKTGSKEFNYKNRAVWEKYQSKSLYSSEVLVHYPAKATLMVTQSSHQNTSILNGKRSGRLFLLPAHPPTWHSQLKAPVYRKSWFDRGVPHSAIKEDINYIRNFLLRFERLQMSTKNPKKRDWLIKWGNHIISNVLYYAEEIQNLSPGWSNTPDTKLKQEHQYFLDPYHIDVVFQNAKEASDWQNIVATDFSKWLNRKIQGKDKKFTPQAEHTKLWKMLMLEQLREHNQMVKAVLAVQAEEWA